MEIGFDLKINKCIEI